MCAVHDGCPSSLEHAAVSIKLNGRDLTALVDSCASDNFISKSVVADLKLQVDPSGKSVSMALSSVQVPFTGTCTADFVLGGKLYKNVSFGILENLCSHVILGYDFQKLHKKVVSLYGGSKANLLFHQLMSHAL